MNTIMNRIGVARIGLVAALLAVAFTVSGCGYNTIPTLEEQAKARWGDVQNQYQRRADLIPNLVETVKGYAAHERGTLDEVVKARNAAVTAQGPAQQAAAENMLSGALRQLFALSEAYPDLKANANFQQLQAELGDLENKIAAARRFFNNSVQEYNTATQRFPTALFASALGFGPKEFFDLGDERKTVGEAPQVKF
jgi:LemA protein